VISVRFLSEDERVQIADLRKTGAGTRQIATLLGRSASTVSRELRRNATKAGGYRPFHAHRLARDLRPLGPRRGMAAHPRRAARRLRVRAGRDRCLTAAIVDSQTVPAADTVPGSRRGWDGGKRTNGVKLAHCGGCQRATAHGRGDRRLDPGSRRRAPATGRTAGRLLHYPAYLGDGGYPGRLLGWAKSVLALQVEIIRRITGASGFHVRPWVWVVERTFAWINKYRRCVRAYESRPDHHEAVIHVAMIGLMTRRLART